MASEAKRDVKRFWVSWWMDGKKYDSALQDGRVPIDVWVTGIRMFDDWESFCAVVDAISENELWRLLEQTFGKIEHRFAIEKESDYAPPSDRFPGFTGATVIPDKKKQQREKRKRSQ